jgi:C_GCAxxG_C_C family probable redox protein
LFAVGGHVLDQLEQQSKRMVTGLSGGVGGTGLEMCGALSAGVLVIGALYGRGSLDENGQAARELAACYRTRFLAEFGDTQCGKLCDKAKSPKGPGSCAMLVERAAGLPLELLNGS